MFVANDNDDRKVFLFPTRLCTYTGAEAQREKKSTENYSIAKREMGSIYLSQYTYEHVVLKLM